MLLRDLLALPDLRLRLLVGGDTALDRPVRWIYTTDLPDPGRYLSGGELVLTGLVWRHGPEDVERFVGAVAGAGAAALAVGEAVFHGVPDDVIAACRRHGLVLLAVPEEVSFAAVTEHVVGSVATARGDRLAARLGRQRQLLAAVAGGMPLTELADEVSETIGLTCRVFTPTGRAVVPGPVPLGTARVDRLVHGYFTADRLPAVVPGQPDHSVFGVGPALDRRLTSWFVAVPGRWTRWRSDVVDAVGELVAFAALDRSRRAEGRRVSWRIADDAVRLVAEGPGGAETGIRLRQAGIPGDRRVQVAVAGFVDRPDLADTARAVLDDAAAHLGRPVVGTTAEGLAVALLVVGPPTAPPPNSARPSSARPDSARPDSARPDSARPDSARPDSARPDSARPDSARSGSAPANAAPAGTAPSDTAPTDTAPTDAAPILRAALGRLEPGLGPDGFAVGLSRPTGQDALAGAVREAVHARETARSRPGRLRVVTDAEVTSHVALLSSVPDDVRLAFATRLLGPVLAYDERHDAGLLETLSAFLDSSGSWSRVAKLLHLHVNTVRYRIGRVEELTGRDLARFEDRVDLFLALRSR
ncbi:MAG TPA: PucR family transcriptional regulator ligand-binding domain-containing protein [Pseudonocardia sp.]